MAVLWWWEYSDGSVVPFELHGSYFSLYDVERQLSLQSPIAAFLNEWYQF